MQQFSNDGLTFDVRDSADQAAPPAGTPEEAQTVVLLHGFPQNSTAWDAVTPRLVEAGRRTLAPDLRGYSPGARPMGRVAYRMAALAGDVIALLDAAGVDRAHVVGHDWGGALAWDMAIRHPERVERLTVLSTPHPRALAHQMRNPKQAVRSWYMAAMQIPFLPELVLRTGLRRGGLKSLGLPAAQARAYTSLLLEPGGIEGAIGWYRALTSTRPADEMQARGPVTCPTTYLWGRHDAYLGRAAAEETEEYVDGPFRFIELDADHWLPENHPDEVVDAILEPFGPS